MGCKLKLEGWGKGCNYQNIVKLRGKYEVAEKNFIIITDSVSDADFSDAMEIQNNSRGTSCISSEAPQHPWPAHRCLRDTRGKENAFLGCLLEFRYITSSQKNSELNSFLVEISDLSKLGSSVEILIKFS